MIAFVRSPDGRGVAERRVGRLRAGRVPGNASERCLHLGRRATAHRRLHAALLGRREGQAVSRDRALRSGAPLSGLARVGRRLESDRPRPRPARPDGVVKFERVGPRVLLVQPNYTFRALDAPDAEQRAVADSFATSVLWGFTVEAEDSARVLVDATAFFLRDAHGVADRLKATGQGSFRLDESRSAIFLPRTKGFPKNTEVEATLTFHGRRARAAGAPDDADASGADRARAPLVRGAAAAGLPAAQLRPARGVLPADHLRLRVADHGAARAALDHPPSPREEGPLGGDVGTGGADRLLRGQRRARARFARRWSTARRGGTRRSKPPGSSTRSRSRCCPPTRIRWTSATT